MSSYQLLEALILCSAFIGSLWLALRKGAPRLSQALGARLRQAGLSERLSRLIFGQPASCNAGCGRCGGCDEPSGKNFGATHIVRKH